MQIILSKKEKESLDVAMCELDSELLGLIDGFSNSAVANTIEYDNGDTAIVIHAGFSRFLIDKFGRLLLKHIDHNMYFLRSMCNLLDQADKLERNIEKKRLGDNNKSSNSEPSINETSDPYRVKYHSILDWLMRKELGIDD